MRNKWRKNYSLHPIGKFSHVLCGIQLILYMFYSVSSSHNLRFEIIRAFILTQFVINPIDSVTVLRLEYSEPVQFGAHSFFQFFNFAHNSFSFLHQLGKWKKYCRRDIHWTIHSHSRRPIPFVFATSIRLARNELRKVVFSRQNSSYRTEPAFDNTLFV